MPAIAPRHSTTAEAAAAAAEFNEKRWVWVPDDKEGYLAGWVVREEDDIGEVFMASGNEVSARAGRSSERRWRSRIRRITL
jgi:myosin protein heavy chain